MADTPKDGETVTPAELKNEAKPTTPQLEEKKTDDGELEKLRKEKEQAEMRANQLANQLKDREKAEAEAKSKELEEKEEFKTLYEQEKVKREEIEHERETEEKRKALKKASKTVLADYPDEVKATAEDLGLTLSEDTDEAAAAFKEKLDKIQSRVGHQRMGPNNPGRPSGQREYSREEMREILNDPIRRDAYYRAKKDGITASMMNPPA